MQNRAQISCMKHDLALQRNVWQVILHWNVRDG